jgi:hypothetical protein
MLLLELRHFLYFVFYIATRFAWCGAPVGQLPLGMLPEGECENRPPHHTLYIRVAQHVACHAALVVVHPACTSVGMLAQAMHEKHCALTFVFAW